MKPRKLYIIFLLLKFSAINAQDLTTIFVDSLKFNFYNKTLINEIDTRVYFVKTNQINNIVLFDDGDFKLILTAFPSTRHKHRNKNYPYIASSYLTLYKKEIKIQFELSSVGWYEECGTYFMPLKYQNSINNICLIKTNVRIFNMAPIDTTVYKLGYRQGVWIGKDEKIDLIKIEFNNDKKHGIAEVNYKDGTTYKTSFLNGKRTSEEIYNFDAPKAKARKKRILPQILTEDCCEK